MISKIILSVTSKQATVGLWRLGRLVSCTVFANDQAGQGGFHQFLERHTNTPIHLIADVVEEDFRLETMPHTSGGARQAMLERKLNQLYRNSTYHTAQFVGRETDKRRDDRFLFIALTNPDVIAPWIHEMESLQAPLAGVYMLPSVSQILVKSLKLKSPDLLLMTRQNAGLRQTYFSNQHLRVSRLNALSGVEERQIDKLYISETEKTRLYLISLRLIGRDTKLQVVFPTGEKIDESIVSQLEAGQGVSCNIIGPAELARSTGLNAEMLKRYPDLLHMHALARNSSDGNLASAQQTKYYHFYNLAIGINAASAACVAGATIIATLNLIDAANTGSQYQDAVAQTRHQEQLYGEVARDFPSTPLPGKELKTAVELHKKLGEISRTPQRLMEVVGAALDAQREIQVNRLRWRFTEDPTATDDGVNAVASKKAVAGTAKPAKSPSGLYEIGFVDGEISNFNGDYRDALESVNRLVETLKLNNAVDQVIVLQQPVNTSSLANLQGSTLDQQTKQLPAALFKIRIVLKAAL